MKLRPLKKALRYVVCFGICLFQLNDESYSFLFGRDLGTGIYPAIGEGLPMNQKHNKIESHTDEAKAKDQMIEGDNDILAAVTNSEEREVLEFYREWTGNKISKSDRKSYQKIVLYGPTLCKIAIALGILRVIHQKIDSLEFFIPIVEEVVEADLLDPESYLQHVVKSLWWQLRPNSVDSAFLFELEKSAEEQREYTGRLARGTLDIYVVRNPKMFEGYMIKPDRDLGISLNSAEWAALFFDALEYPKEVYLPDIAGESYEEREQRYRLRFQRAIPDYPMLARITGVYGIQTGYEHEEVKRLRQECLNVKTSTSNRLALRALRKLIWGCDQAVKSSLGVFLSGE